MSPFTTSDVASQLHNETLIAQVGCERHLRYFTAIYDKKSFLPPSNGGLPMAPIRFFILAASMVCSCLACAQQLPASLGVATWNMAWLMGRTTFDDWVSFCAAHDWQPADDIVPTKPLPFCDVHSGKVFPLSPCQREHPNEPERCQESKELHTWFAYSEKITVLSQAAQALEAEGIDVVFLQEVYDRAAVRLVFPENAGWKIITTAELPDPIPIAQQVGVAYRGAAQLVGAPKLISTLATAVDGHRVRPGLEVTFALGADEIDFLVVHLKAGCRNDVIDAPHPKQRPNERNDEFAGRKAAKLRDCKAFRSQVPALEDWIDIKVAHNRFFALVGDFNRTLLLDGFNPDRARLDGGDSKDPKAPITDDTKIAHLTPEISDNEPAGATLDIARANYDPLPAVEKCKKSVQGIDHFAISKALAARLHVQIGKLNATVLGYGVDNYAPDKALPSDHCPHFLKLESKRTTEPHRIL